MNKALRKIAGTVFCIALLLSLVACGTSAASGKASSAASSSSAEAVSSSSASASASGSASADAASSSSADASSSASADSANADAASSTSADASSSTGKTVYFAAPLFSQAEKDFNLELTKVLEDHGYQVFLPQRDGYLAAELQGKTEEEMTEMIFDKDYSEVMKADICFIVLDGRAPDEGACVELGIAYANGKRCYAAKTDARSVEYGMDINPMITGCCTKIFKNLDGDKMIAELDQYLSENEL